MLTKQEKSAFRSTLFCHLDGIATTTTLFALYKKGLLNRILEQQTVKLETISKEFNANTGYLNVALRVLCSQGWLTQNYKNDGIYFSVNNNSVKVFQLAPLLEDAINTLKYSTKYPTERIGADAFIALEHVFNNLNQNYNIDNPNAIEQQLLTHIEGLVIAPIIVMLGVNGMFHKYFMEASFRAQEYHKDPESFKKILDFFTHLNWFIKKNDTYQFTDKGLFFAKRASAYGVTVSYLPTFHQLDDLLFGDPLVLQSDNNEPEKHVHREMNVWGSGGAHSTYFKIIDDIIIEIFNKPIEEQPKGILDMGCGNGAFIQHLFDVIEHQTLRGKLLDDHPLLLVGADFNQAALKVTRANLIKADIWAKVIWGDIGKPELLATDLKDNYNIELKDLLNVRTFLDHNRIWEAPKTPTGRQSTSTGAYTYKGQHINNDLVEDSLLEHLLKWKPYTEKFGLLVIELHTVTPELVAKNIGKTPATAYDATHGYSDQFILELDVFLNIAKEAGLYPDDNYSVKFPDNALATVSVNLLKGNY
ncbi:MAG: class I SAM-dependent methyltransferase [Flavobacteriaceae bacterium]